MSALLEIRIDNYQFTTSECAKPACDHPFDSIQETDSHSADAMPWLTLQCIEVMDGTVGIIS
jgi:hypothetical protein